MNTFVIILNYETGSVDQLETPFLWDSPTSSDEIEHYIEHELDYNLSSCYYMTTSSPQTINNLNF